MSEFKIAWLLPDTLNLHGERGNILALERFATLAGFQPVVDKISLDREDFDPFVYDVLFVAPGSTGSIRVVLEWLEKYKDALEKYVADGRPMMVTGTSAVLFGESFTFSDGETVKCLGITGTKAVEREKPYGDDVYFETTYNGRKMEIIGAQIQMVDVNIGDALPFGTLKYGYGNCGKDRTEGALVNNAIFTNGLGPLLVCDPWLTAEIIKAAAAAKGIEDVDIPYDMELEKKSFETKKEFIINKKTALTNCK